MTINRMITTLMIFVLAVFVNTTLAFDDMPDQVTIDVIAKYFDAVEFDHALHTDLGEDCSACHHHATGTGTAAQRCIRCHADDGEVAQAGCGDCHVADPFSAENINREATDLYQFHTDKPGLKAAYHWNCIGCHEEMDGPTACVDCHQRTLEGEAFYHIEAELTENPGGH